MAMASLIEAWGKAEGVSFMAPEGLHDWEQHQESKEQGKLFTSTAPLSCPLQQGSPPKLCYDQWCHQIVTPLGVQPIEQVQALMIQSFFQVTEIADKIQTQMPL